MNLLRTSAIAAAALFAMSPLMATASTVNSSSVVVKATVVPDCVIATQPGALIDFGTQDKNAGKSLSASVADTGMTITCNNGTAWQASVPASVTLAGYTDSSMGTTNNASLTATLALSSTSGVAAGSATPIPLTVTAAIAPGDFTVGYYQGSFVVGISY